MGDCVLGFGSQPPLKPVHVSLLQPENAHHPLMKQLGQAPMVSCGEKGFPHDTEHFLSILQGGNDTPPHTHPPPVPPQQEETQEGSMMNKRHTRE